MPCQMCGHTIQTLVNEGVLILRWCPRCGTLHNEIPGFSSHDAPKLIDRVRRLVAEFVNNPAVYGEMVRPGVVESVSAPEVRGAFVATTERGEQEE